MSAGHMNDDWVGDWVIRKNLGFEDSPRVKASRVADHVIEVHRAALPPVRVSYFKCELVDEGVVSALLAEDPATRALFNLDRNAEVTATGYAAAEDMGVPILRFGESPKALALTDPADYHSGDTAFVERGLRQHFAVGRIRQIGKSDYDLESTSGERLVVCVRNEYEVSAASVRRTIDAFPSINVYATSNPHALTVSKDATAAGESAGVRVLMWKELLRVLGGQWS